MKALTYRQLKEFINQIDEIHLDRPAIIVSEDYGTPIQAVQIINEECVEYDDSEMDEIIEIKSIYHDRYVDEGDEPDILAEIPKGYPVMYSDNSLAYNVNRFSIIEISISEDDPLGDSEICKKCGCTLHNPCHHPDHGFCWWVDDNHDLCSHCSIEEIANDPMTWHPIKKLNSLIL